MEIKIGDKVKVLSNSSGHNYVIGNTYVTLRYNAGNNMWTLANVRTPKTACGNGCYTNELKQIVDSKEELLKTSKELEKRLSTIKDKINFMSKHKIKEFDQKEFLSHRALEFMKDDKKTDEEKLEFFKNLI